MAEKKAKRVWVADHRRVDMPVMRINPDRWLAKNEPFARRVLEVQRETGLPQRLAWRQAASGNPDFPSYAKIVRAITCLNAPQAATPGA